MKYAGNLATLGHEMFINKNKDKDTRTAGSSGELTCFRAGSLPSFTGYSLYFVFTHHDFCVECIQRFAADMVKSKPFKQYRCCNSF